MNSKEALDILKTGKNCLLTGPAGSGKTHILNQYIKYLKDNEVAVAITASTGIAATHLGGQTIHSWSGIGVRREISEDDLREFSEKSYLNKKISAVGVLIIDEISMLHHYQLDMVDSILRFFKNNNKPFGGVQVVLAGDFLQLPPVSKINQKAEFVYRSMVWGQSDFQIIYLESQYRQSDESFLSLLQAIRSGSLSPKDKQTLLERREGVIDSGIEPTKLYTHNIDVDKINKEKLKMVPGEIVEYEMNSKGSRGLVQSLVKNCLAPEILQLKPGAKVMFVKNNFELGFANGTLGTVVTCGHYPTVRLMDGREIEVEPMSWSIEEEGKIKAEIKQIPLRLAWAITVHKSQGMSLDSLEVDLTRAFESGMGYVALSRVRSISGLVIKGLSDQALAISPEALEIDNYFQSLAQETKQNFISKARSFIEEEHKKFLEKVGQQKTVKVSTVDQTKAMLSEKMSLTDIARKRNLSIETIISHLEKILQDDPRFDSRHLKKKIPPKKFKQIYSVLSELDKGQEILLSPVKQNLPASISFNDIRLVRLFYYQER